MSQSGLGITVALSSQLLNAEVLSFYKKRLPCWTYHLPLSQSGCSLVR